MSKKQFKIKPKVWPKEYTFEEFKRLNPNINENVLVNYYNKYLQEYAENRSRFLKHFNDSKKLLANNLKEVKNRYDDSQYFLRMYYSNQPDAVAGSYPNFTPTDIKFDYVLNKSLNLTHWFKAEPEFIIESEERSFDGTTNVTEVISWSNAAQAPGGNSFLIQSNTNHSGIFANNSIGLFRGQDFEGGNTGGVSMKLTDTPSFGSFTYFAVLEFNSGDNDILAANNIHDTSSVVYTDQLENKTDRSILFQKSTTTSENSRLVFTTDALSGSPDYAGSFSESVLEASITPFLSDDEVRDAKVSGSTLANAITFAINTLDFYTASNSLPETFAHGRNIKFYRYPATSSFTNKAHNGNFFNASGESQNVILSSSFNESIIASATDSNIQHGIWAGQRVDNQGVASNQNRISFRTRPNTIEGPMEVAFDFAVSSSGHDGDSITRFTKISNDPKNNEKFVLMVTKDAPENAIVKVFVNNVSVFDETNPTGSAEVNDPDKFEPKFFGIKDGQTRTLNGKVYEMGFYDGNLSLTDRAQLYYYLGIKHNVPGYDGPSELKPYNYPDTGYLP